jgi:molybdopterin-guanine dinucleotide biosynthesis protein A
MSAKINNITGVIIAGGKSSRFGSDKAMAMISLKNLTRINNSLKTKSGNSFSNIKPQTKLPMIQHIGNVLSSIFSKTLIICNDTEKYSFLPFPTVRDIYPDQGPLAGIHAGLVNSKTKKIFITGCDLPLINSEFIRYQCSISNNFQVTIPSLECGLEPLCAIYNKDCVPVIEQLLENKQHKVSALFDKVGTRKINKSEILNIVPDLSIFTNINNQSDLEKSSIK